MKPHVLDAQQREQRYRSYSAAAPVAKQFPGVEELAIELRFADPDGKHLPSPQKRIFTPDMQAFFELQCPLRDCSEGGFDLTAAVPAALGKRSAAPGGKMVCKGRRPRNGERSSSCDLELSYQVSARRK